MKGQIGELSCLEAIDVAAWTKIGQRKRAYTELRTGIGTVGFCIVDFI